MHKQHNNFCCFFFIHNKNDFCFYKEIRFVYQVWSLQSWWKGKPEVMDHRDKMEGILRTVWLVLSAWNEGRYFEQKSWSAQRVQRPRTERTGWMTIWTPRNIEDRSDSSTIVQLATGTDFGRALHQAITSLAVRLEEAVRFFFSFSFYNKLQIFLPFLIITNHIICSKSKLFTSLVYSSHLKHLFCISG